MIEELVDTTHWLARGHSIRTAGNPTIIPLLERTEKELRELLSFVRVTPVAGMNFGAIRLALFIPFGGPALWNRKVDLYLREIEYANDKCLGKGTPVPDWEWSLSGLDRPLEATGGRVVGDEPDSPGLPGDFMETL